MLLGYARRLATAVSNPLRFRTVSRLFFCGLAVLPFVAFWLIDPSGLLAVLQALTANYEFLAECATAVATIVVAIAAWRGVNAWKEQLHGTKLHDQSIEFIRRLLRWRDLIFELRYEELSIEERNNPKTTEIMNECYTPHPKLDGTQTNEEARKTDREHRELRHLERRQERFKLAKMAFALRVTEQNAAQAEVYAASRELEVLQETRQRRYIEQVEQIAADIYSSVLAEHYKDYNEIEELEHPELHEERKKLYGDRDQQRDSKYQGKRSRWDRTPDDPEKKINKSIAAIQRIFKEYV